MVKIPDPKQKIKGISRRAAYKIYANIIYWRDFKETIKAANLNFESMDNDDLDKVLENMFSSRKEFLRMSKTPIYTKEQCRRVFHKVNKDVFNKDRKTWKWKRYKIGQHYRRTTRAKELEVFEQDFVKIKESISSLMGVDIDETARILGTSN